jgi:hypothetical protein
MSPTADPHRNRRLNPCLFKKGERRIGRAKGTPNKRTREVAEVLETAASKIGLER